MADWQRVRCCGDKSRSFYCPVCCRAVGVPEGVVVPRVTLPLRVAVVLKDARSKSTAIHAAVLAPTQVDVYEYGEESIPAFDRESTVLAFPSADAVPFARLEAVEKVTTLVVLCCPWRQPAKLLALPQLQGIRHVKIGRIRGQSEYWRVGAHDAGHLSTIEALRCLLAEYVVAAHGMERERARVGDGGGGGKGAGVGEGRNGSEVVGVGVGAGESASGSASAGLSLGMGARAETGPGASVVAGGRARADVNGEAKESASTEQDVGVSRTIDAVGQSSVREGVCEGVCASACAATRCGSSAKSACVRQDAAVRLAATQRREEASGGASASGMHLENGVEKQGMVGGDGCGGESADAEVGDGRRGGDGPCEAARGDGAGDGVGIGAGVAAEASCGLGDGPFMDDAADDAFHDLLFFFETIRGTIQHCRVAGDLPWEVAFKERWRAKFIQKARPGVRDSRVTSFRYGRPQE